MADTTKRDDELKARQEALMEELQPVLDAAEALETPLTESEKLGALGMLRVVHAAGFEAPTPAQPTEPSRGALHKTLMHDLVDPFYKTIVSLIVKQREELSRQPASADDPSFVSRLIEWVGRAMSENEALLRELDRSKRPPN